MALRCSNGVPFVVIAPEPTTRTGIQVRIYEGANPNTLLDVLPATFARKWTDPLRGAGSGSFQVSELNPKLTATPDLLAYGNIASFFLDEIRRFSIIIEQKAFESVNVAEDGGRVITVQGRGAKSRLEQAEVYPGSGGNPLRAFTASNAGAIVDTFYDEATTRGALTGVTLDFDAFNDSNNAPWAVPLTIDERAGTDLLRVVGRLENIAADAYMTPDLRLQMFNERGIDRTLMLPLDGPMVLQPGDNILDLSHDEEGGIINTLLIETATAFVERQDAASVAEYGRREGFLSLGNVSDTDAVDRAAAAVFARLAFPAANIGLRVADLDGQRPYVDFDVGDYVLAPNSSRVLSKHRVRALTISESPDGEEIYFEPELANISDELEIRTDRWLQAMARGTLGGTSSGVAEPVAGASLGEISSAVSDHETTADHHSEIHTVASHDTSATGAELDELTDGSTTTLHTHASGAPPPHAASHEDGGADEIAHNNLDITADDHHAEAHTVASHSDTSATGAELDELTDGSETTLHSHAGGGGGGGGAAGALEHIETIEIAAGNAIEIDLPAGYLGFRIMLSGLQHDGTTADIIEARFGPSGSPSSSSVYDWSRFYLGDSTGSSSGDGDSKINMGAVTEDQQGDLILEILPGYDDADLYTTVHFRTGYSRDAEQFVYLGYGQYRVEDVVDVLELSLATDDFLAQGQAIVLGYTDAASGGGGVPSDSIGGRLYNRPASVAGSSRTYKTESMEFDGSDLTGSTEVKGGALSPIWYEEAHALSVRANGNIGDEDIYARVWPITPAGDLYFETAIRMLGSKRLGAAAIVLANGNTAGAGNQAVFIWYNNTNGHNTAHNDGVGWNTTQNYNANRSGFSAGETGLLVSGEVLYLRVWYDHSATEVQLEISPDGIQWRKFSPSAGSNPAGLGFTPTHFGVGLYAFNITTVNEAMAAFEYLRVYDG